MFLQSEHTANISTLVENSNSSMQLLNILDALSTNSNADMEKAFKASVRENPHDPVHRLIYADWLEERDRPTEASIHRLVARSPEMIRQVTRYHRQAEAHSRMARLTSVRGLRALREVVASRTIPPPLRGIDERLHNARRASQEAHRATRIANDTASAENQEAAALRHRTAIASHQAAISRINAEPYFQFVGLAEYPSNAIAQHREAERFHSNLATLYRSAK